MMKRFYATSLAAVLLPLIAACESTPATAPNDADGRNPGLLQIENDGSRPGQSGPLQPGDSAIIRPPEVIAAPDTVAVGQPFQVVVTTVGPNGCWSAGNITAQVNGLQARLIPYDVHSGADVCTEVLGYLPHRTNIRFDQAGIATIRVEASKMVNGVTTDMVAERKVVVR